jgi:hypothetical protein
MCVYTRIPSLVNSSSVAFQYKLGGLGRHTAPSLIIEHGFT